MKSFIERMLLLAVGAILVAGCDGDNGAAGPVGPAGAGGTSGFSCWDLNQNATADADEDLNGDGVVDVLDCREPLPGTEIAVSGGVFTDALELDRFASVMFVPAGAALSEAIDAVVDAKGKYTAALDQGDYVAYASRPGYEEVTVDPFTVSIGGANTLDFDLPAVPDGEYISSENCGVCHTTEYASFIQTGHPFKLNKVVNGEQPLYPFTNLNGVLERVTDDDTDPADPNMGTDNTLGTPVTWDDVTYVIGGYFWKARFVDKAGAIVTGSSAQYNFETDAMSSYNNNTVDKPYNCGNCHTTGWRHTDAALNPTGQDGLTFMQGTFHKGGIQCEACHGAGAKHARFRGGVVADAQPRSLAELTAPDAGYGLAVACGECHTRDGERDYPDYVSNFDAALAAANAPDPRPDEMGGRIAASGGLVRHHEQYDEVLGIDPDTLDTVRSPGFLATHGDCSTCHYPHGSSVNVNNALYTGMPGVDPSNGACLTCHGGTAAESYDPLLRSGGMQNLACGDCHLPDMAKSATSVAGEADRPTVGDVRSHIFGITLDSTQPQFTADGKFAYPTIDEDWACRTCHNSTDTAEIQLTLTDELVDLYVFHNNVVP